MGTTCRFEVIAARVALFCSSCFFGGRGGSLDGSYAGARTWYNVLPLLPFVLLEPSDSVEMPEAMVDIDSEDSRRVTLRSDDLRGGKAGDCWLAARGGGRGGSAGEMRAGGLSTSGWLPRRCVEAGALSRSGGLFAVWARSWGGLFAGGGGGGGGFFFAGATAS